MTKIDKKSLKPIPRLKGKPKYTDAPRFPLIYSYEGEMKSLYSKRVKEMAKQMGASMKKILNVR